ncbi:MAG: hypothetical protein WC749_10240 [Dehalococcoidia bacterium]
MIKKKVLAVSLGLVIVAVVVTGAVALGDGSHKAHIGPIKLDDGTAIEAWGEENIEVGQVHICPAQLCKCAFTVAGDTQSVGTVTNSVIFVSDAFGINNATEPIIITFPEGMRIDGLQDSGMAVKVELDPEKCTCLPVDEAIEANECEPTVAPYPKATPPHSSEAK